MPINFNVFGEKTADALDKAFVQKSVTGFMDTNPDNIQFINADTVLVGETNFSGLGDYDRDNGFPIGSISSAKRSYTLTQDRGRAFQIDAIDYDSLDAALKKGVMDMAEWQDKYVVPEIDAYTLSKLYAFSVSKRLPSNVPLDTSNVYSTLVAAKDSCMDESDEEDLVCFIPRWVQSLLNSSTEITKMIDVREVNKNGISTKVGFIDNMEIVPVNAKRMYSAYRSLNGVDDDQYNGGFVVASGAVPIQYIVMPKKAATRITRTKKIRVFQPNDNILKDAYAMQYRRLYDVICLESKKSSIFVGFGN